MLVPNIRIRCYELSAEWKARAVCLETLTKGENFDVIGWLKADSYTDKGGQIISRVTFEISDFKVIQKEPKEDSLLLSRTLSGVFSCSTR